jgi:hypothetical protein
MNIIRINGLLLGIGAGGFCHERNSSQIAEGGFFSSDERRKGPLRETYLHMSGEPLSIRSSPLFFVAIVGRGILKTKAKKSNLRKGKRQLTLE